LGQFERWHLGGCWWVAAAYTKGVNATNPMEFDTCLWDEIQDAPGEIFDIEAWEDEADQDPGWGPTGWEE